MSEFWFYWCSGPFRGVRRIVDGIRNGVAVHYVTSDWDTGDLFLRPGESARIDALKLFLSDAGVLVAGSAGFPAAIVLNGTGV